MSCLILRIGIIGSCRCGYFLWSAKFGGINYCEGENNDDQMTMEWDNHSWNEVREKAEKYFNCKGKLLVDGKTPDGYLVENADRLKISKDKIVFKPVADEKILWAQSHKVVTIQSQA